MSINNQKQLEQYTAGRSQELLIVTIDVDGILEEIMIFKGFSSCLSRATEFDPDLPVIPEGAKVVTIDRLKAPYNPFQPFYIAKGLTWDEFVDKFIEG
jgi:hypothetical protein